MKITHNQNCPAKSLNSLAPELLENQKSKLNNLVSLFTVVLVVSSMPFPGDRQLRRWTDFPRFYLDPEGGFVLRLKLSACDTTLLQFPPTPAYSKIVLGHPPPSPRLTRSRQTPEPATVPPAGSYLQFPAASSQPPCRFKAVPALKEILGSSPLTLHPCPSIRGKGRTDILVKIKDGETQIQLGSGPQKRSMSPSRPFAKDCTPGWSQPPFSRFLLNPYSR